jgi:Response regulators consisting of a CheY-like receiver domain and a winged-helix DNA-binding domain
MRLLVVEDEKDLNRILVRELKSENYCVDSCFDGEAAWDYLCLGEYDGVILDIMLPKMDGFSILKRAREKGIQTPVLFLTARDNVKDIVKGLDIGANDYLTKPFQIEELLARIRAMIRVKAIAPDDIYRCHDLEVNNNKHTVKRGDQEITLSSKEFSILLFLIRNQGNVVTREQIEANIWDYEYNGNSNIVDVYIRYLRKKIDDEFEEKLIRTIRGVGYLLKSGE